MSEQGSTLDGNALGALLGDIFVSEPTTVERICASCHSRHPAGAHRAYSGAGAVLRCPTCGDVAVRVAELPGRRVAEFKGTWILR